MSIVHLSVATLVLALSLAGTAQAKTYSLSPDSAGQTHIGNGLALPIQPAATVLVTGTVFPPLLIPKRIADITVQGTTAMASQQAITVPKDALSKKSGVQLTVGVFASNPTLYAVGTNLGYQWPNSNAVFNTAARTGASTTTIGAPWGAVRYSVPTLPSKFGGPARFAVDPATGLGINPLAPVTVWAVAIRPAGNPPCTHTALTPVPFPGPGNGACVAAILHARPGNGAAHALAAAGAPLAAGIVTTSGLVGTSPGVVIGKFGASPAGTRTFTTSTGMMSPGPLNVASSKGFPFTAGRLTLSAVATAAAGTEMFIISGTDSRDAAGVGQIQMVAGAISTRLLSGTNANRAWVRLVLEDFPEVPALAPSMRAVAVGLIMLTAVGFALRMRNQGQAA